MAFIRNYMQGFKEKKEETPIQRAQGLPAAAFAAASGVTTSKIPLGFGASGGGGQGRAPLLADYLRANVGSEMAQKAKADIEERAKNIEAKEYGATEKGVYEKAFTGGPELAKKQAEQIEAESAQLGSQAGREAYLKEKIGKQQQYTSGETMLDAALMGGLAGSELGGLAKKYEQLYETLAGKQKAAQAAFDAKKAAEKTEPQLKPGESRTSYYSSKEEHERDMAYIKAARYRREDEEKQQQGRGRGTSETKTMTREQFANRMGMTLEEWILAGEPGWETEE